jgi:hypothetical protein
LGPKLRKVLREQNQLAVGVRSGCEIACHVLQALLDLDNSVLLSIDIANAFNSIDRAHVLQALYEQEELSSLFKLADFAYSEPSPLIMRDSSGRVADVIMSERGVRQGDPLGLALFALGLLHPVEQAVTEEVTPIAFADDVTFAAQGEAGQAALARAAVSLDGSLSEVGMRLAGGKCKLLIRRGVTIVPELKQVVDRFGFEVEHDSSRILGAILGRDSRTVSEKLLDMACAQEAHFDKILSAGFTVQESFTLLRSSLTHRFSYLTRAVRPSLLHAAAQKFDEIQLKAIAKLLNLEQAETAEAKKRVFLPLKRGGLGLKSAVATSPAAWLALEHLATLSCNRPITPHLCRRSCPKYSVTFVHGVTPGCSMVCFLLMSRWFLPFIHPCPRRTARSCRLTSPLLSTPKLFPI